ncbi:MAG: sigma-70 family RNA polymerase sigma factor [Firmicutes bacterium]|nr:sigma-70 family RNA polymerase sigma factor [Bacillota bacterium]
MSPSEEAKLVERARQGDVDAFEALIIQYERKVYNLAYRLTGNPEDASDLAQEAFVRVYQSLGDFRGDSSFATWLYRIVANACRDELRRRQRQRTVSLEVTVENEDGEMVRQYADEGEGPDQTLERVELQRLVRETLATLDEDHRQILILRDFQDLSYQDIADLLNLSLGTVKSRINRARHALKVKLARELELLQSRVVYNSRRRHGNEL